MKFRMNKTIERRQNRIRKDIKKMWRCREKGRIVQSIIYNEKTGYYDFTFDNGQVFSVRGLVCENFLPTKWVREQ